jgi:hypothetical protein
VTARLLLPALLLSGVIAPAARAACDPVLLKKSEMIECLTIGLAAAEEDLKAAAAKIAQVEASAITEDWLTERGFTAAMEAQGNLATQAWVLEQGFGESAGRFGPLLKLASYLVVDADTNAISFDGANVYVRNGTGSTAGAPNGLGNLFVGYNESTADRDGSHNLVVGAGHGFTSYGNIIGGYENRANAPWGLVVGTDNRLESPWGSISGGSNNTVGADRGSIGGGFSNSVTGSWATVVGGRKNRATGLGSVVSGGESNVVDGAGASAFGGKGHTVEENYRVGPPWDRTLGELQASLNQKANDLSTLKIEMEALVESIEAVEAALALKIEGVEKQVDDQKEVIEALRVIGSQ